MQKFGTSPLKQRNCRHDLFSPSGSPTSYYDGNDVPSMELLKINYVKPSSSSKSKKCRHSDANPTRVDIAKPSLYKYAVYKKLNRSSKDISAREYFQQFEQQDNAPSTRQQQPMPQHQQRSRYNSQQRPCDENDEDGWNYDSRVTALNEVTSRANRIDRIKKSAQPIRPRSFHYRCPSPEDADPKDLPRANNRFVEHIHRDRYSSPPPPLPPVSRDSAKSRSFGDESDSTNPDRAKNRDRRTDDMNSRINRKIQQIFESDRSAVRPNERGRSPSTRYSNNNHNIDNNPASLNASSINNHHQSAASNRQNHVKSKAIIDMPFTANRPNEITSKKVVTNQGNHIMLNLTGDQSTRSSAAADVSAADSARVRRHHTSAIFDSNCRHNEKNSVATASCGYKNCNFNNCPMSYSSKSLSDRSKTPCRNSSTSDDVTSSKGDLKNSINHNKSQMASRNNHSNRAKSFSTNHNSNNFIIDFENPHEKSTKITVKLNGDAVQQVTSTTTTPITRTASTPHGKSNSDHNDVQNLSGKSLTKITTDELLLRNGKTSMKNLNNAVLPTRVKNVPRVDVNLKNSENRKFNDLRSSTSENTAVNPSNHRLKIFVKSSSVGSSSNAPSSISSSDLSSLTDSERDFPLHDPDPSSVSKVKSKICSGINLPPESGISSSSDFADPSDHDATNPFPKRFGGSGPNSSAKLGCDGAIFWNNCYFYDDKCSYCSACEDSDDTKLVNDQYICVCNGKSKIDVHDTRPRSMEGAIDSGISLNGDTGSSPDSDISAQHLQNQPDAEARRLKRGHVLTELLETERIYVSEMSQILRGYRDQMVSEDMAHLVPPSLQGKEDILFGNLHELFKFHSEVFLKDLENCISTTELVALCFVQRRDTFYRLYSFYCQNIPRSERLRETLVDAHLFLQECQKRLGHKLPLAAYLLKPVQRITKYQLLLKDLLRFSDSGTCTKELQKALDCMLIVLKCVNDSMHQIAITGFPSDLSQQGELLLQDSFQVWTESKKDIRLRMKTQQRHIFLYQKVMLFCKQGSKTGHNKSTYQYKHHLKMSQIGLTESVRGDPKRFEVWLQGRQEVHTLQAPSIEIKNKWVTEIKKVLLNQLEELKGESIKQYGLNHKQLLRQTVSWDSPCGAVLGTQRAMSCDTTSESNRNSNGSDECPSQIAGMGSLSSERDSCSDYSNSEDELSIIEDSSTPGSRFIALADYCAVGHSEVSMREGDTVELLKVGCAGWWFVRVLDTNVEGWTPAAYLGPANRKTSRSCSRNQDKIN